MAQPLTPELEAKAQQLAQRLQDRSRENFLDIARTLVSTPDEQLFGETEFVIRDTVLQGVAHAYSEHLEKKGATKVPPSTVPIAKPMPNSTAIGPRPSSDSVAPSPSSGPTTIAEVVATANALGTGSSD